MSQHGVGSLWGVILPGTAARPRLRRAVERAGRLVPHDRVLVVSTRGAEDAPSSPALLGTQHVVQPAACGTAAETFLALLKIARQDPDAIAVVLPGHHQVEDERRFGDHILAAVRAVSRRPDLLVVIGPPSAQPREGLVEPGEPVAGLEDLEVRQVKRFVPDAGADDASADPAGRSSTPVLVGSVRTLIAHGRRHVPDVLESLEPLEEAFGRPEEALLCDAVYEAMPHASLATLLEHGEPLAMLGGPDATSRAPLSMPLAA